LLYILLLTNNSNSFFKEEFVAMDSETLNGVEHANGAEVQTNGTNGETNGNEVVPEPELIKLTAIQVEYMKRF
jgi:hypothetical protein